MPIVAIETFMRTSHKTKLTILYFIQLNANSRALPLSKTKTFLLTMAMSWLQWIYLQQPHPHTTQNLYPDHTQGWDGIHQYKVLIPTKKGASFHEKYSPIERSWLNKFWSSFPPHIQLFVIQIQLWPVEQSNWRRESSSYILTFVCSMKLALVGCWWIFGWVTWNQARWTIPIHAPTIEHNH